MIEYTPSEMVRLELLSYDDPEGLHPIELAWRQLARKLMEQTIEAEKRTESAIERVAYKNEADKAWKRYQFPEPFKPTNAPPKKKE